MFWRRDKIFAMADERQERQLETPLLLMATPQVQDPFFHKSVVLLLHHDDEGSFGFNLNRPTTVSVAEILEGLEIEWAGDPKMCAYLGGPVQPQLGTVLYDEAGAVPVSADPEATTTCVYPGLVMTQHVGDLARLAKAPPPHMRYPSPYSP